MKLIKNIFIVALFFYVIVTAIVLAMAKPKVETVLTPIIKRTVTPTASPTLSGVLSNQPTPTVAAVVPTVDTRCIITIDGSRYDVTDFRNLHSGGDVFQCATDMSTTFHDRHSDRFLRQMQQYLI